MSRPARSINCDATTLDKLKGLIVRRTIPSGIVLRAKILTACIAGETVQSIVSKLHTSPATVNRWKGRFIKHGLPGIEDQHC